MSSVALQPFPAFPLYSLQSFPAYLRNVVQNPSLTSVYLRAQPIHSALLFCIWNIIWTWLMGELTGNVSQVDRVWSFLPVIYTAHFVFHPLAIQYLSLPLKQRPETVVDFAGFVLESIDHRQALALATQLVWSARLTFNAIRRGFFDFRSEDYRWPIYRSMIPNWAFKIFNLGFIAIFQNILLMSIALPSHYLLLQAHPEVYHSPPLARKIAAALQTPPYLTFSDYALAGLAVLAVFGEWVADNQQQAYQTWKHLPDSKRPKVGRWSLLPFGLGPKIRWGEADRKRGFVAQGLWKLSRHPAFALEQTFWWLQALFPVLPVLHDLPSAILHVYKQTIKAKGTPVDQAQRLAISLWQQVGRYLPWWALGGAAALSGLFVASTIFTESITKKKYPLYSKAYQRRVGMFWPTQTYLKRVWVSATSGNDARIALERDLGWWKVIKNKRE